MLYIIKHSKYKQKSIKNMKGCTDDLCVPVDHLVYSQACAHFGDHCSGGISGPIRIPPHTQWLYCRGKEDKSTLQVASAFGPLCRPSLLWMDMRSCDFQTFSFQAQFSLWNFFLSHLATQKFPFVGTSSPPLCTPLVIFLNLMPKLNMKWKLLMFCMWAGPLGLCAREEHSHFVAYWLSQSSLFLGVLLCSSAYLPGGGHENLGEDEDGVLNISPGKLHTVIWKPGGLGSTVGPDRPEGW